MGHVVDEHAIATEFSYYFKGNGERRWHLPYNKPRYGVSGFVGTVGNRKLFGVYYGAYGFISLPFWKGDHFTFAGRLGSGLSIAPKVYDHVSNNLSIATSTHVNALVSLAAEARYEFGPHALNAIIDMTHFSNGAAKVPNLGLNVPFLSFGYAHRIRERHIYDVPREILIGDYQKYWEFGAVGILSAKEVYPVGGPKYPVYGFNLMGRRYFKPQVGMEVSFDIMHKASLRTYTPEVYASNTDVLQLGAFVGYLMPFNHFHIVVGMGAYLRDKSFFGEDFYHRVGMRYVFDNGININCVLKSHWARADYVEYGVGYTFKR
ncbi:MAG: acyloxyacyl hydrolase [Crocinitomicaceae bacterium]